VTLALLAVLAVQDPQSSTDIQARIPDTHFVVSLGLRGWKEEANDMLKPLGKKLLFAGSMAPEGSMLTVIVEPNVPPLPPQTWRQRFAPGGKPFDIGQTPCADTTSEPVPGIVMSDFHAYFATRTHVLDVHVSRTTNTKKGFPAAEFQRIVESLRVRLLRRGQDEDYPDAIAEPMTVAAVLGVDQKAWRDDYLAKHADDWAAHFANAEFLHEIKAPLDQQLAAYDKALALAAKVAAPDAKAKFATAMLHEGRSLALFDAKRFADSIAPLEKACALLQELHHKERGGPAYNLACSHALCKHEGPAVAALAKAIDAEPHYRELAATNADFAAIKGSAAFRKLLAAPAPAPKK
jgi:hypothetical protein